MSDSTQDLKAAIPPRPVVLSGKETYNMIMEKIEMDLAYPQVESLDEKYKGETEEEKKQRLTKYEKANVEYDKQYQVYIAKLREDVDAYKKAAFAYLEKKNDEKEKEQLENLESSLLSL
ncbi:hypothetical protein KKF55_03740 [Patescibacteria group bacterium]|nr:hypothetical protein [Patescibacteria group bacterium]